MDTNVLRAIKETYNGTSERFVERHAGMQCRLNHWLPSFFFQESVLVRNKTLR